MGPAQKQGYGELDLLAFTRQSREGCVYYIARLEFKYLSIHLFLQPAEKFRESINPGLTQKRGKRKSRTSASESPPSGGGDHWRDYSSHNTQFGDLVVQLLGVE